MPHLLPSHLLLLQHRLPPRPEGRQDQPQSVVRATGGCSEESIEDSEDGGNVGSSEDRDDSNDENFSSQSGEKSEEEALTAESAESAVESEEDFSTFLFEVDLTVQVAGIIIPDSCTNHCVHGKTRELSALLCSLSQMTKKEKTTSLYTPLVPVDRKRRGGDQERFNCYGNHQAAQGFGCRERERVIYRTKSDLLLHVLIDKSKCCLAPEVKILQNI